MAQDLPFVGKRHGKRFPLWLGEPRRAPRKSLRLRVPRFRGRRSGELLSVALPAFVLAELTSNFTQACDPVTKVALGRTLANVRGFASWRLVG